MTIACVRIDLGVPAADGAVNRIEDQAGRGGLAVGRDHEVRGRVVDDTGGFADRTGRLARRGRHGDRPEHVARAVVDRGEPGGERIGHNERPARHGRHAPAVQVGVVEVRNAGLVAHQIGLLVAAEQLAVFERFERVAGSAARRAAGALCRAACRSYSAGATRKANA